MTLIICGSSITFPPPPHPSTFFPPYPLLNLHQVKICDGRVPEIRVSSFSSHFFYFIPLPLQFAASLDAAKITENAGRISSLVQYMCTYAEV